MKIRPARPEDARSIHDVHMSSIQGLCSKDYTPAQIDAWGRRPYDEKKWHDSIYNHWTWVVESEAGVSGVLTARPHHVDGIRGVHLNALYMAPAAAGHGAGRALMAALLERARASRIDRIRLDSTITAREFYRRHGFRDLPCVGHVTIGGVDVPSFRMELDLSPRPPPPLEIRMLGMGDREAFVRALPALAEDHVLQRFRPETISDEFAAFLDDLERRRIAPDGPWVPETFYFAFLGGEIVGRISCRHELNDKLKRIGGHVGYTVHPAYRNRGVATEMLRQLLMQPAVRPLKQVLVTCDDDNLASVKVITRNLGIFEKKIWSEELTRPKLHYYVNLATVPDLETERLVLSRWRDDDANDVYAYASDPEVARTSAWTAHQNLDDSRAFLSWANRSLQTGEGRKRIEWAIRLKATGTAIGSIGFTQQSDIKGELGYALSRTYWNRGLVTEAGRAVIDHVMRAYPEIVRVQAVCLTDNPGSWRVMEKCGMRYEGTERSALEHKGSIVDIKRYALTRADRT